MIKDTIFEDLKTAMKMKDTLKKGVLQIVKANLDMAEKEKFGELTEQESIAVIQKEMKQIKQSIDGAVKACRQDIISQEKTKLTILEAYIPKQLSFDDIVPVLCQKGVHNGMSMGDAMKIAKEHLTGKTDNGTIAKAVKHIITGG